MQPANLPALEQRTTIFRPAPGTVQRFLVVSHDLVALQVHWTVKTRLCVGDERCPACYQGLQPKWLGYVAAITSNGVPGLLELSAHAGHAWSERGGDLHNHVVEISRPNKHVGATISQCERRTEVSHTVWSNEQILDQLCRVMQLPRLRNYLTNELWMQAIDTAAIAQLRLDLAAPSTAS